VGFEVSQVSLTVLLGYAGKALVGGPQFFFLEGILIPRTRC